MVYFLPLIFGRIQQGTYFVPHGCYFRELLVIESISLINISQFSFSISSFVSFGKLCLSRNWSISSKLCSLWHKVVLSTIFTGLLECFIRHFHLFSFCLFSFSSISEEQKFPILKNHNLSIIFALWIMMLQVVGMKSLFKPISQ